MWMEGERERESDGGRKGGMEGERERESDGGRKGGMEGRREGWDVGKEGGR